MHGWLRWGSIGVLGMGIVFCGCGKSEKQAGSGGDDRKTGERSGAQSGASEPIRFWHAMAGPLGKSLDGLVSEWNTLHPESRVESVSMGQYEALSQKIMAAVAAGGPPDLAQCYEAWTANLIANGSIVPLDEFVGPDEDLIPLFRESSMQGGKIWSFPFNKSVRCLYYNCDLFRAAGLDPSAPPRTWAAYRETAKRLTHDDNGDGKPERWGLASQMTVTMFENLIVQNGGSLLAPGEREASFHSPEGVEALEFMTDFLLRDGTALMTPGFDYQNEFLAGNVGMIEGSSVSLSFLEGKYTFELGIAPLPAGKVDTQLVAGTDVVLFKSNEERQAAAWAFVEWFTAPEQTARWSRETGYLPVRKSAFEVPAFVAFLDEHKGLRESFAQLDRSLVQPKASGWYAGRRILETEAIEPVLRGKLAPKDALDAAAVKVNTELARELAAAAH